jgi:hypothetical protein
LHTKRSRWREGPNQIMRTKMAPISTRQPLPQNWKGFYNSYRTLAHAQAQKYKIDISYSCV